MSDTPREFSREGLLTILNILPVAVMVFDQDLSVILVNDAALALTAKTRDDLLGRAGGEALGCVNQTAAPGGCGFSLNCATCRLREALGETLDSETPLSRVETTMTLRGNGQRMLRFSTYPLALAGEKAILLTVEDLTDSRQYEQEHIENEKMAAVLATTGGVCHELSQPLQVIMGYSELLAEKQHLDPETSDAVAEINREVRRLARLAHDLTQITRYETKPYLSSKIIDVRKSALTGDPPDNPEQ